AFGQPPARPAPAGRDGPPDRRRAGVCPTHRAACRYRRTTRYGGGDGEEHRGRGVRVRRRSGRAAARRPRVPPRRRGRAPLPRRSDHGHRRRHDGDHERDHRKATGGLSGMPVLTSTLDPRSPSYLDNRAAMLERLTELESALRDSRGGGGEKYVTRHHARGKLLPRERIELLIDRDSPFLELSAVAAWGTDFPVGASVVTGIGIVEDTPCMLIAHDPTVRGGAVNPYSLKKTQRAAEIARQNRLPLINLVESGGADLPTQADIFIPGGAAFRDLTQLSAARIPTISVVFGNATAGGAYVPGMCDYTIFVRDHAKVFLAGPPLVKMATGEVSDDESLGGAFMHATRSGLADFIAEDERDALRLARSCVRRFHRGTARANGGPEPKFEQDDLLAIPSADLRVPFDPREVLARILDGSEFDEFKPAYGTALCTGWGEIHGHPIGVLANSRGVLFSAEAQKAAQFIQL